MSSNFLVSSLQVASAGFAKRKQCARPPAGRRASKSGSGLPTRSSPPQLCCFGVATSAEGPSRQPLVTPNRPKTPQDAPKSPQSRPKTPQSRPKTSSRRHPNAFLASKSRKIAPTPPQETSGKPKNAKIKPKTTKNLQKIKYF